MQVLVLSFPHRERRNADARFTSALARASDFNFSFDDDTHHHRTVRFGNLAHFSLRFRDNSAARRTRSVS